MALSGAQAFMALSQAIHFGRDFGAEVLLLHVQKKGAKDVPSGMESSLLNRIAWQKVGHQSIIAYL